MKYYKYVKEGVLSTIWELGEQHTYFNFERKETESWPNTSFIMTRAMEEISKDEFDYLKSIWVSLKDHPGNTMVFESDLSIFDQAIVESICLECIEATWEVIDPQPKLEYHLYSEDSGISIYGYSWKTREELVDFFETVGRKRGFRVKGFSGQTKGFVHNNLFNKLSYHIKDFE